MNTIRPAGAQFSTQSVSGDLKLRIYQNDINGNESLSFKTDGLNFLTNVNFAYDHQAGSGEDAVIWKGLASFQGTDDEQFQIRNDTIRLQNIYLTVRKPTAWEFTGGYFSERFTSYTMNTSLLGLNAYYQLTDTLRWDIFAGRDQKARGGNQFRRLSYGNRLEWAPIQNHAFGLSFVQTKDDISSLSKGSDRAGVSDTEANDVWSLDYEGSMEQYNLRISGEWASSDYDTAPTESGGEQNSESAKKFRTQWQNQTYGRFQASFEEVDPGFRTLSGFASSNRTTWRFKWERSFYEMLSTELMYEKWENGLGSTTRSHKVDDWEFALGYDPGWQSYWQFEFDGTLNFREDEGGPGSGDPNEADEMLYEFATWNKFGKNVITFDYIREDNDIDSEVVGTFDVGYERTFTAIGRPIGYSVDTRYGEDENELGGGNETDRTVRVDNQLIIGKDQPEEFEIFHGYRNEHNAGSAEIVQESMGIEYRYLLSKEMERKLSVSYSLNDVIDKGDSTQNYEEQTAELNFSTAF